MRYNTEARRRPVSPSPTDRRCWSSRISALSARCSTSRHWPRCRATSPSGTAVTPPPARPLGRTPSQYSATPRPVPELRWATTEIWSTPPSSARRARDAGLINPNMPGAATTDSDILGALLAHGAADSSIEQAALELLPTVRGAFCLIFMDENTLYAARDPFGVRPLSLGRLGPRLGGRLRNRRPGHRRRLLRPRHRARRAAGHRRRRRALEPVRQPDAEGLRLRVRLPGPPGQHPGRALGARRASRHRPPAGPREAGRGRPGHRRSRVRHPRCRRLRRRSPESPSARA